MDCKEIDRPSKGGRALPKKWKEPDGRLCHKIGVVTDREGLEVTVFRWWHTRRQSWIFDADPTRLINYRRGLKV